ncbi:Ribonuclease R [invertebrate metagenome]|uniref:exoribonuclease II n=1 Tax=invertebrate metagenome TaxID=1711999 RepID=A0A2H9T7F9_9ZZZZ
MSEWWKDADPDAAREATRYENPVPSRELIMQFLEERGAPASHRVLCREMEVTEDSQQEALLFRLRAMVRDGQLLQNRKGAFTLLDKLDLICGRIQGHRDGFGFLIPEDGSDDLYLSAREMRQAFDGDRVLIRESGVDRKGRREGQIVDVLERRTTQLVGRYFEESGTTFVIPENSRISQEIIVKTNVLMPTTGQYVLVEIVDQPARRKPATGIVKEILGDRSKPGMEVEVAVRTHDIPHEWPEAVMKQCQRFSAEVREKDKKQRIDLRDLSFVTIDGEDARDFDDAVYCESKRSGGWRLYVAIADVSHYVKVKTALDDEASERGTSVYFPGHVIPMLPEVLSNGLCSLNPDVDRLAMVCEMTISARGKLSGYHFYEGLIRSHARLTYTKVWDMLGRSEAEEGKALREEYQAVLPHLDELYKLYKVLKAARQTRGTIDFDTVETQIIFDKNRKIDNIVPRERNDAHKLIEECMLCANVSAARFLEKHGLDGLYRVHEGPTMEKRLNLDSFLSSLALSLPKGKIKPRDVQALMASVKERPDFPVIQTVVLRSMSQAVYTSDNKGHFGLAFDAYTHFTSPIRRYPDLMVHRAIRHIIRSETESIHVRRTDAANLKKSVIYPYDGESVEAIGEHCSRTERRADEATRDAMDWLKCEYMQQHLGSSFTGVVSSVTGFGLFVMLKDVYVEGLLHISSLPGDYYVFDPSLFRLTGERTGKTYHIGDELEVTVVRVDIDNKKIDFELTSALSGNDKFGKKGKQGDKQGTSDSKNHRRSAAAKARLLRAAKAAKTADEVKKSSGKKKKSVKKKGVKKKPVNKQLAQASREPGTTVHKKTVNKKRRQKKPTVNNTEARGVTKKGAAKKGGTRKATAVTKAGGTSASPVRKRKISR